MRWLGLLLLCLPVAVFAQDTLETFDEAHLLKGFYETTFEGSVKDSILTTIPRGAKMKVLEKSRIRTSKGYQSQFRVEYENLTGWVTNRGDEFPVRPSFGDPSQKDYFLFKALSHLGDDDQVIAILQHSGSFTCDLDVEGRNIFHYLALTDQPIKFPLLAKLRGSCSNFHSAINQHQAGEDDGPSPLMLAVENHQLAFARELIKVGANGQEDMSAGDWSQSVLGLACAKGSLDMVEFLLKQGVKPDLSALNDAVEANREDVVQLLLKELKDIQGEDYLSPLDTALKNSNERLARQLFDHGCTQGLEGANPVGLAMRYALPHLALYFLEKEKEIDRVFGDEVLPEQNALRLAVWLGETAVAKALLAKKTPACAMTVQAAMELAQSLGNQDMISLLRKHCR